MPTGVGTSLLLSSIIGGGASIAGGALANKGTSTTSPTLDPQYQGLQGQILKMIQARLAGNGLPAGFEEGGVKAINRSYDQTAQSANNALVARGLATSPVAANVDMTRGIARTGDIGGFRAGLPLIARDLQTQDLGIGNSILQQGRGSTTTGTSGGGAAGAFTNLAQYLGYLTGKGAFKQGGGTQPAIPGFTAGAF